MAGTNMRVWFYGLTAGDANAPAMRAYARKTGKGRIGHIFPKGGRKRGHASMPVTIFNQQVLAHTEKLMDTVTGGMVYGAGNISRSHKALLPKVTPELLKKYGLTETKFDDLMKELFGKKGTKLSDGSEVKEPKKMVTIRGNDGVPAASVFDYYDTELVAEVIMPRELFEPIATSNKALLDKVKSELGIEDEEIDEDLPEL
jgi:hypothetical protein